MENTTLPVGWLPASLVEDFSPDAYDFQWNTDYTAFRPVRLRWTDNASYARYQSEDSDEA